MVHGCGNLENLLEGKKALLGIFESSVSSYLQPGGKSVKVKIIFSSQSPAHLSITLCVVS